MPERLPIKYGESFNAEVGVAFTATGAGGGGYSAVIAGASDGLVIESAAVDTVCLGFIREEHILAGVVAAGTQVAVYYSGVVWAVSSAAIAKNAECGATAAGRVVTVSAADLAVGICMATVAGAGERFPLLLRFYSATA